MLSTYTTTYEIGGRDVEERSPLTPLGKDTVALERCEDSVHAIGQRIIAEMTSVITKAAEHGAYRTRSGKDYSAGIAGEFAATITDKVDDVAAGIRSFIDEVE